MINYCQSNSCSNNGTCYNNAYLGQHTCYCMPGFTGMNCEGTNDSQFYFNNEHWPLQNSEIVLNCFFNLSFYLIWRIPSVVLLVRDACSSYPCIFGYCNNVNNGSSYYCSCFAGASGKNCENGEYIENFILQSEIFILLQSFSVFRLNLLFAWLSVHFTRLIS